MPEIPYADMSNLIEQIQRTIPEDKKNDLITFVGGGFIAVFGWINSNPDVLAAWGTFLGGAAVMIRLVWNMWKERKGDR